MHSFRDIVFVFVMAWAFAAQAGHKYSMETMTDTGRGGVHKAVVEAVVEGTSARFDFKEGGLPGAAKGYILTRDSGKNFTLVNPEEKTYMVWDMAQLAGLAGDLAAMSGGMFDMTFSDVKVEKLGEDAGPAILGMPTKHVTMRSSYVMETAVFGMRNTHRVVQDQEIWTTSDIKSEALGAWMRGAMRKTGNAELDKLIDAQMSAISGFPLKMVANISQTDKNGKTTQSTSTTEVTTFEKMDVATALFEVPEDYNETSMLPRAQPERQKNKREKEVPAAPLGRLLRNIKPF